MFKSARSVLFVCSQNICRSIAAEAVFRYLSENAGLAMRVASAGTHALPGCLPDPKMCATAALRGYDLSGLRSCPFTAAARFDLILAADKDNLLCVRAQGARAGLLMEYSRAFDAEEVLFTDGGRGYDTVLDFVEDACLGLLKSLSGP